MELFLYVSWVLSVFLIRLSLMQSSKFLSRLRTPLRFLMLDSWNTLWLLVFSKHGLGISSGRIH